jgi:hypothetical protein
MIPSLPFGFSIVPEADAGLVFAVFGIQQTVPKME